VFGIEASQSSSSSNIEHRKIQVTGGSTYIVSLPKKWVKQNNLNASDIVAVERLTNGNIQISPFQTKPKKNIITIDIKNQTESELYVCLIGAYLAGADVICVDSKSKISTKHRRIIRKFLREARGMDISGDDESKVYLVSMMKQNELPLKFSLNRMYLLVTQIVEDAISVMNGENCDLLSDLEERERQIDARRLLVARQVAMALQSSSVERALGIDHFQGMEHVSMARALERMGDHAHSFANLILHQREHPGQNLLRKETLQIPLQHLSSWKNALKKIIHNTNSKDITNIIEAKQELHEAISDLEEFEDSLIQSNKYNISSFRFSEKTRRLCAYSIDLAETLINILMASRLSLFDHEEVLFV